MHILEVMIAGLMVVGAIVAVSSLNSNLERSQQGPESVQGDKAQELLATLQALPATNTSVHYSQGLEESIVQHLAGDVEPLPERLRNHHSTAHRMLLQMGGRNHIVVGPEEIPSRDVPHGASAFWFSELGQTLVRPSVSHLDTQMDAQFELLPAWVDRVADPPGHSYEVDLQFSDPELNGSSTFFQRLPLSGQEPLAMTPSDWVVSETQVTNADGTMYEWDVNLNLASTGDGSSVWLGGGDVFEVVAPAGWDLVLPEDEDWALESNLDDPVWLLEYTGRPLRAVDEEAWFNLTLERSTDLGVDHHEVLRVRSAALAGGEVSLVLTPDSSSRPLPGLVFVSQPSPLPLSGTLPMVFTVTNPTDDPVTLDGFSVRFSQGHQFKHEPSGWSRVAQEDGTVLYTLDTAPTVWAHDATTLELPVVVEDTGEGDNVKPTSAPVLEYLGPGPQQPPLRDGLLPNGDDPPPRMVSHPSGDAGLYTAWLPDEDEGPGVHTVRVGHSASDGVPPGVGTFTRLDVDTNGFLPGLQEARHGMRLDIDDASLAPGDDLWVSMSTAGLVEFLQANEDELTGEPVRLEVRSGDLLGHVTGDPDNVTTKQWALADMTAGMQVDTKATFGRSALLGPVLVDAKWVIPTVDHGEVDLNFLGHALRFEDDRQVTPVFFNAHLQFWLPEARGAWQADT